MFPNNPQFLHIASLKERLMCYSASIVNTGLSSSFSVLWQISAYQISEFLLRVTLIFNYRACKYTKISVLKFDYCSSVGFYGTIPTGKFKVAMSQLLSPPQSWSMVVKLLQFLCCTYREQFKHIPIRYYTKPGEPRNS